LRTIDIELGKGPAVVEACRKLGITEQTYYRWKKEYGGGVPATALVTRTFAPISVSA
jgi:transposase-like protein